MLEFRKAWATATKKAGLHGILFHDLRRSAIRNMVRAGVDPAVAMKITGHRTKAVFDRYNILDDADLRNTITKTSEYVSALPKERKVADLPAKGGLKGENTDRTRTNCTQMQQKGERTALAAPGTSR